MSELYVITRDNIPGHGNTLFYLYKENGIFHWNTDLQIAEKYTKEEAETEIKTRECKHLYKIERVQ